MKIYIVIITYFLTVSAILAERPTVETALGKVRGIHKVSYNGKIFSAFEGIPYAKPPLGKLRFEEPQEIEPWQGVWEATNLYECLQLFDVNENPRGEEDCLYMNVYVPLEKPDPNKKLDVIVHIHGGAFMLGSSHSYIKPTFLMDRDVVFVTFNYRLGILGFLSTNDKTVPGNNGLKDQNLALKWIQKHIHSFGGNPDSVTLTGLSAGAAGVHYHYLSPLSKGLFHRIIAHSAVALNPWALQESSFKKAKTLASALGCKQISSKDFVNCLKQRPAKVLIASTKLFYEYSLLPFSPFAPVIENKHENAFLTDHPYKLLTEGKINDVPFIGSVTTEEDLFNNLDELDENWEKLSPILLDYNDTVSEFDKKDVSDRIKQFYFGKENISNKTVDILNQLLGDRHFIVGSQIAIQAQATVAKSPIYYYVFGYSGQHGLYELIGINTLEYGVSHGDDVIYIFDSFGKRKLTKRDERMKDLFLNMYTTFAKTNKPAVENITWEPVTDQLFYLKIESPDSVSMEKAESLAPIEFWESLPMKENKKYFMQKDEL